MTETPSDPAARPSVVSATAVTFGSNVLGAVLQLANVLVVARLLGPVGRGDVVFLITIAALTSRLFAFGIAEANVNFASREPRLRPGLATNSLLLALAFGWAGSAIILALIAVFPGIGGDADRDLLLLTLVAIPALMFQGGLYRLVQADYAFRLSNVATLLPPVANLTVNGLLAALGALTVGSALGAWIAGQVASVALLCWYVQRRLAGFGRPSSRLARRALGFGLQTHLGRVMMIGNYRLDQWFIGAMAGARELGLYSVAVAWFDALTYLPTALAMVLRPDMVRATPEAAAEQAARAFRATAIVTALLAAGTIVIAPLLCVQVFGEEFRGAVDDLRWLALGAFGIVALRIFGSALTAQRKPLLETAAVGVGLVVTIAFDLLLIPRHGGTGAAIASTLAYGAAGVAVIAVFGRSLGLRWRDLVPRRADVAFLLKRLRALR